MHLLTIINHTGSFQCSTKEIEPLIKLWMVRILVSLNTHNHLINKNGFANDNIATFVGLGEWIDEERLPVKTIKESLYNLYESAEQKAQQLSYPKQLENNVKKLAQLANLSKVDCHILTFAVILENESLLNDCADFLGDLTSMKTYRVLSIILNLPEKSIRQSLAKLAPLEAAGILTLDANSTYSLSQKLDLLSSSFADRIYSSKADPITLLESSFKRVNEPELTLADYPHIEKELNIMLPLLSRATNKERKGTNIYLHSSPGTGKTEFVKVLAKNLGCELFEISSEDEKGDPITGKDRLKSLKLAQIILKKRKAILLFDEVEDVFSSSFFESSAAQKNKAWINRTLETNPIPTLWLSNCAIGLDAAFIRRYDFILELPVPPRKQRIKILRQYCEEFLSDSAIEYFSESTELSPGVISKAASVIKSLPEKSNEEHALNAFSLIVNNTLKMQGFNPIHRHDPNRLPSVYNPQYINADTDVGQLVEGIKGSGAARLCIYGPPGTGKTAYVRWMAQQLDMPLLFKRGSDLISMWVGETEKNIAATFDQAAREESILVIDEVDSFLQDRREASRSWEVTAVNEMLTQMETFSGVFIATTNLIDNLDQASLRRFDLKMKFDYLLPEKTLTLFSDYCQTLQLSRPDKQTQQALKQLGYLTPGDFSAVVRQHQFNPLQCAVDFLRRLKAEVGLKENSGKRPIGFI